MQCIQQGHTVVTLTLYRNGKRIDVVHISGTNHGLPLIRDKQITYRFELLELKPYPTVQCIELQHYVAELIVTKTRLR